MSEEKRKRPGSEFVLSDGEIPGSEQTPDPQAILSVARRASRSNDVGAWLDGHRLDDLVPIADAAQSLGQTESSLRSAIEDGRILTVDEGSDGHLVPSFQLLGDIDASGPVVAQVNSLLEPVCANTRTIWLWFLSPKDELGGRTPAEWIAQNEDSGPMLLAAKRDSQRLAN